MWLVTDVMFSCNEKPTHVLPNARNLSVKCRNARCFFGPNHRVNRSFLPPYFILFTLSAFSDQLWKRKEYNSLIFQYCNDCYRSQSVQSDKSSSISLRVEGREVVIVNGATEIRLPNFPQASSRHMVGSTLVLLERRRVLSRSTIHV